MFQKFSFLLLILATCVLSGCKNDNTQQQDPELVSEIEIDDPHSYGDDSKARIRNMHLNLKVDFNQRLLEGSVTLFIDKNGADSIFLDSKGLVIKEMSSAGQSIQWSTGAEDPILGSKIGIDLTQTADSIVIVYRTSDRADAIQWLDKTQTLDKKGPFMYSQGQAILTRTWIPIQDSPGIRFPYSATITVPAGMLALMSAQNPQTVNASGVYHFEMKEPVPAYLIAISAGFMEFKSLDARSGVYAEKGLLEKAAWEFAETPAMITATEQMYGPYIWGRYDILVLPPAFPFGGMENPMLTFATPTIIAGDRSLANLIAHELAHSWSGNLVTNATWNDFWLNEGFTVYIERRIVEVVKNKDYADMTAIIGRNDLEEEMVAIGPDKMGTQLKLQLAGHDPDEGMTDIAYEKGCLLIDLLEQEFGREQLDKFLSGYFKDFKYKPITTEIFEQYLREKFDSSKLDQLNISEWLYAPGLPNNAPVFKSKMFDQVAAMQDSLLDGSKKIAYEDLDFNQWLYFLRRIKENVTVDQLNQMDAIYNFTNSGNAEIRALWLEINILKKNTRVNGAAADFLKHVGRRKFQVPLYQAFLASGQKAEAQKIYAASRDNYHFVSRNTLDVLLK